jgi:hypothetical protein
MGPSARPGLPQSVRRHEARATVERRAEHGLVSHSLAWPRTGVPLEDQLLRRVLLPSIRNRQDLDQ